MGNEKDIEKLLAMGRSEGSELYNMQFMRWDCPACSTVGLLGPKKNCPNCGYAKSDSVEDLEYLPDGSLYYTEEQFGQIADASNPDWECGACGTMMGYALQNCANCGAPRTDDFAEQTEYGLGEVPSSTAEAKAQLKKRRRDDVRVNSLSDFESEQYSDGVFGTGVSVGQLIKFGLIATPIAGILTFLIWFLFISSSIVQARVVDLQWQRQISTEQYKTVVEEDWSVPSGGRRIDSYRAIRSYNQVLAGYDTKTRSVRVQTGTTTERYACGQTKTGSGGVKTNYCTRTNPVYGYKTETYQEPRYVQEPVYDTKYKYEIDKWVTGRTLREQGSGHNPRWPDVTLAGNERQGAKSEDYVVVVKYDNDKTYQITMDEWQWQSIELDQYCQLEINRVGAVLRYTF